MTEEQAEYRTGQKFINKSDVAKNFTILRNEVINDKSISWEARGVLIYLLSKPEDWVVRKYDLVNQSPAGKHVITRVLKELEEARYLERNRGHNEKGHWEWCTYVYDKPTIPQESMDGSSTDGLPIDGESGDIPNTNPPSTESQSTESLAGAEKNSPPSEEILGDEITNRRQEIREKASGERMTKEELELAAVGVGEKDVLEGYPVDVKELLYPFVKLFGRVAIPKKKGDWIATVREEWIPLGASPSDIIKMYEYAQENEWTLSRPGSITSAFDNIETDKQPQKRKTVRIVNPITGEIEEAIT